MIHRTIQEPIHKTHVLPAIFKREYLPPKVADPNEVKKAIDEAFRNALSQTPYSTKDTFENEYSEQTIPQEVQDYSLQTEPEIEQTTTPQIFQSQMIIPQTQSFIVPIQNQSQIYIPTPISQTPITKSVPLVNIVVPQPTQIIQPPIIQPVLQPTQIIQSVPQQPQIIQPVLQQTQIVQPVPQPIQVIQPVPPPTQIIQPIPQATPLLGQTIIMPIGPMTITTQPLFANTYQASTY